jgi:hypothetical protein
MNFSHRVDELLGSDPEMTIAEAIQIAAGEEAHPRNYCHKCGAWETLDDYSKRCQVCMESSGYGFNRSAA